MGDIPLIKPVLIVGAIGMLGFYLMHVRSRLLDRMLGLVMFIVAVGLILFPQMSSRIAATFGVGRGVDLVLYLIVCLAGYSLVILFARVQEMERRLTVVSRELAIHTAREAETKIPGNSENA